MLVFKNFSLFKKFMSVVAITFVLLLVVGIHSYINSNKAQNTSISLTQKIIPAIESIGEIKAIFKEFRISAIKYPTANAQQLENFKNKLNNEELLMLKNIEIISKLCDANKISKLKTLIGEYKSIANGILLEESKAGKVKEAIQIVADKLVPIGNEFDSTINELKDELNGITNTNNSELIKLVNPSSNNAILIAVIIVNIIILFLLSKDITTRVKELTHKSTIISGGDLNEEINPNGGDEIGELGKNFEILVRKLRSFILPIKSSSQELLTASENIDQSAINTEKEISNVLNKVITLSSSSEEMVATSNDISKNCNLAASASDDTKNLIHDGMGVVQETVYEIQANSEKIKTDAQLILQLGQKTNQINSIIDTIQNIADQTNLLALNAAIEAARAGEHGRGFAVVADEVRSLAVKTSSATGEINSMIRAVQDEAQKANDSIIETVTKMETLASNAQNLQNTLTVITDKVTEVNTQITQIASATEEQSGTSLTMSQNLQDISVSTKEISETIEGFVVISNLIKEESLAMSESSSKFNI